jgi:hypothetical protein
VLLSLLAVRAEGFEPSLSDSSSLFLCRWDTCALSPSADLNRMPSAYETDALAR